MIVGIIGAMEDEVAILKEKWRSMRLWRKHR